MGLRIIQNFFSKFFEHKQQKTQNFCLVLAEKGHHEFIPLPINLDLPPIYPSTILIGMVSALNIPLFRIKHYFSLVC